VNGEDKFSAIGHDPAADRKVNDVHLLWAVAGQEEKVFPRPERSPAGEPDVHDSNAAWHIGQPWQIARIRVHHVLILPVHSTQLRDQVERHVLYSRSVRPRTQQTDPDFYNFLLL